MPSLLLNLRPLEECSWTSCSGEDALAIVLCILPVVALSGRRSSRRFPAVKLTCFWRLDRSSRSSCNKKTICFYTLLIARIPSIVCVCVSLRVRVGACVRTCNTFQETGKRQIEKSMVVIEVLSLSYRAELNCRNTVP